MFKDVFWKEPEEEKSTYSKEEISVTEVKEEVGKVEEQDYDPFEHRHVANPTSDFGALAHILKTSFGSGILAMPMAFKYSGLVIGALGTIILGVVTTHCVQMLVWNSQVLCKRYKVPFLSFPETGEKAFLCGPVKLRRCSKCIGILITAELLGSFILGNTVYVVFVSHTIYQTVEYHWKLGIDIRLYSALLWAPLIIMCMLPNLKSLVPFSVMANILMLFSVCITLYYIFRNIKPVPGVNLVSPIETWPLFMGTFIFAIEGIGTVISIENEMKHPNHFIGGTFGILYIGMIVVVSLYGCIGFFGYLEYGDDTKGSVALNLPMQEPLAQAVKILIAFAIFFTYALQFYVPITLIVHMIIGKLPDKFHFYTKVGVRAGLVSFTIFLAVLIPHLEVIISLVGAICFSTLGLLFPALIDTMANYPNYGRYKWRLWKNVIIQLLGVLILTTGIHSSTLDIIEIYIHGGEEQM